MDLTASARRTKALQRRRGVRSAADLLHLALLYGPSGLSLRSVASHATEAGIADLCDVSLLDRLRNAGEFLADVLDHRKRSSVALLPLGRTDVLGRPGYGVFELSLWMTLPTTRRVSSGGSSC